MFKEILFLLGIAFIILDYKRILLVETEVIVGCFVLSLILFYTSIHKKNKKLRTPQAVYNVG